MKLHRIARPGSTDPRSGAVRIYSPAPLSLLALARTTSATSPGRTSRALGRRGRAGARALAVGGSLVLAGCAARKVSGSTGGSTPVVVAAPVAPGLEDHPGGATPGPWIPPPHRLAAVLDVEPVEVPKQVACRYPVARGRFDRPLHFGAGLPIYARGIRARGGHVWVPAGAPALGAFAELELDSVILQGTLTVEELALLPARRLVVADCLVPSPRAVASWVAGRAGALTVEFSVAGVELVGRSGRVELGCDDLGIVRQNFTVEPPSPAPSVSRALAGEAPVPLRATVDGPVVARVDPRVVALTPVTVYEQSPQRQRIGLWSGDMWVFGWVDSERLTDGIGEVGTAFGHGGLGLSGAGTQHPPPLVCDHEVPLVAEVDAVRRVVGRVMPGNSIEHRGSAGALVHVTLPDSSFLPQGRLLVPASALQGCRGGGA